MEKTRYKVTCTKCKGSRIVDITKSPAGEFVDWLEDKQTQFTIISGRPRLDGLWGWECICSNKDIMTEQEKRVISNHQSPKAQEIDEILSKLESDKPLFNMERV